jgi:large subunit ribosomal protein L15
MELHQIKPIHKDKKGKRVGRGGAHGRTAGRGNKGQKAKPSRNYQPIVRELIKKYPKLRGYRFKSLIQKASVLNLDILDKKFNAGETVSPQILIDKNIVRKVDGFVPKIKILGSGKISKALIFESCLVSESAKEKIGKAGGEIK